MRRLPWLLLAVAVVFGTTGLVLGLIGERRGLDFPPDRGSELFVQVIASVGAPLFGVVGLLITRKEPRHPIGWIFLGAATAFGVMDFAYGYADLSLYGGESWPGAEWAAWIASWLIVVPFFVAPCYVAQLFPDGQSPSPGWGRIFRLSIGLGAWLALSPALQDGPLGPYPDVENPLPLPHWLTVVLVDPIWALAIVLLFGLSLVSIVKRFGRSQGVERRQLNLLVLAGVIVILGFGGVFAVEPFGGLAATVFGVIGGVGLVMMPVAVAVAILRYRLYEIDRLVSRTLVYVSLTMILGAAYIGLVLAGQALFSSFAGGSNLAIAGSTLVVAALFLPVRSRVQRFVDRRFYRSRYDAQRTLESFGLRLREQIELDALTTDLGAVVAETMQPAHVAVWLRRQEQ